MSKKFNNISIDEHRAIASKGGKAAHVLGVAHEFTSEEARAAGRLGGAKISQNIDHMRAIGERGRIARRLKTEHAKHTFLQSDCPLCCDENQRRMRTGYTSSMTPQK